MTVSDATLLNIALLQLALLGVGWAVLFAHGMQSSRARARDTGSRRLRKRLVRAVATRSPDDGLRAELRALERGEQWTLLASLARNLRGEEREWLAQLAADLGWVARGLELCDSRFWWRRLEGARLLTLAGAGSSRMVELARDPHPLVRAQVAEWCGQNPSSAAVHTLVEMLGDPDLTSRFAVQDSLVRLSDLAVLPLARKLEEVRDVTEARAALGVAAHVRDSRLAPAILELSRWPEPHVRAAAYRALGGSAGQEAVGRLEEGLSDPVADVRVAAALAMGELGHWEGGPMVSALLGDTYWDVRHAAGQSLRLMGPPGKLLLRRAARASDRFVADMALYTMDVDALNAAAP